MLLVTGGAGFIGANVVASLNDAGRGDIVVNDVLGADTKWRNLQKRQLADFIPPADLLRWLDGRKLDAVIHMGAISDTTAKVASGFRIERRNSSMKSNRATRPESESSMPITAPVNCLAM